MQKLSRPVVVLLTVSIVVIAAALGALSLTAFRGNETGQPQEPAAAAGPSAATQTPITESSSTEEASPDLQGHRTIRTTTKRAPLTSTRTQVQEPTPTEPTPETAPQEPEVSPDEEAMRLLAAGKGRVDVTLKDGQAEVSVTPKQERAKNDRGPYTVRLSGVVRQMRLNQEQLTAIKAFEATFEKPAAARIEKDQRALEEAAQRFYDAKASGDQERIAQAQQLLNEAAKAQEWATAQVNARYAQGIRKYLTPDQATRFDQALVKLKIPAEPAETFKLDEGEAAAKTEAPAGGTPAENGAP